MMFEGHDFATKLTSDIDLNWTTGVRCNHASLTEPTYTTYQRSAADGTYQIYGEA